MKDFTEEDYAMTLKICRDINRISLSAIQRRMRIGYVKASLIIEEMGSRGEAERVEPDGTWKLKEVAG